MDSLAFHYVIIWTLHLRTVCTKRKEFEDEGFTLKKHQTISVHTTSKEFKNTTITGHHLIWIYAWKKKTRAGKSHDYDKVINFHKASFSKCFLSRRWHENPPFSNSSDLKNLFKMFRFPTRISVDGRLNRRNKATFSNFSSVRGRGSWLRSGFSKRLDSTLNYQVLDYTISLSNTKWRIKLQKDVLVFLWNRALIACTDRGFQSFTSNIHTVKSSIPSISFRKNYSGNM